MTMSSKGYKFFVQINRNILGQLGYLSFSTNFTFEYLLVNNYLIIYLWITIWLLTKKLELHN